MGGSQPFLQIQLGSTLVFGRFNCQIFGQMGFMALPCKCLSTTPIAWTSAFYYKMGDNRKICALLRISYVLSVGFHFRSTSKTQKITIRFPFLLKVSSKKPFIACKNNPDRTWLCDVTNWITALKPLPVCQWPVTVLPDRFKRFFAIHLLFLPLLDKAFNHFSSLFSVILLINGHSDGFLTHYWGTGNIWQHYLATLVTSSRIT